ncbi:hypothetical protein [uncultured Microscilla sp.]|uniref:hypothetical protein n=1 Tax=uncultured Microscilla sp. TaxID=432653 RepID=UPI002617121B|nr:hypothetical protein [uncultured Microscilla sp.]
MKVNIIVTVTLSLWSLSTQAQTCYLPNTQITHWDINQNTLPRYVVASIKAMGEASPDGFIMMLGTTSQGVYTIEGGSPSDAVAGEQSSATLVFTPYTGQRKMYELYKHQDLSKLDEKKLLRLLWKYDRDKIYPLKALKRIDYQINPKSQATKQTLASTVKWTMKIVHPKTNTTLFWHLSVKSNMSHCFYQWKFFRKKGM